MGSSRVFYKALGTHLGLYACTYITFLAPIDYSGSVGPFKLSALS